MFESYFLLRKKTIQFPLSFNLYFLQKRAPKLSICHLPTKCSVWRHKQDTWLFQFSKLSLGSYVPVTKNYRTIRSRCLVHEFSFTDIVYRYYFKLKFFVAASIIYDCGCLFLLWKSAQNDAHCNCIKPP